MDARGRVAASARAVASAAHPYTRLDASRRRDPVNTEYLLWFAVLVVVAGAALLWLAIGGVPDLPPEPALPPEPDLPPDPGLPPGHAEMAPEEIPSEPAGEDRVAEAT